jgi:hypothetical protein
LRSCFQKAPDAGKKCSLNSECLSGVCDLEIGIKNNECSFVKKELTGEKGRSGKDFYASTYLCKTIKPGMCTEAINGRVNPGGYSHTFKMDGQNLIENFEAGSIF